MKRSEMIKEIAKIFESVTYENVALKRAKMTMDIIEQKGMRPPYNDNEMVLDYGWESEEDLTTKKE